MFKLSSDSSFCLIKNPPTTMADGQLDECEDLSHPHCGTPPDDGPPSMTP